LIARQLPQQFAVAIVVRLKVEAVWLIAVESAGAY
jgi:hypothetical protein